MNITYDPDGDAVYITFEEGKQAAKTSGDWPFHIDTDEDGTVVGLEIMDAYHILDRTYLEEINQSD